MNVPVISLAGFNFNSRCGESILINSNLKDLVAKNKDDYISKVVSLANDIDKLKKIRKFIFDEVLKTNTFNTMVLKVLVFKTSSKINFRIFFNLSMSLANETTLEI